jgi:hypothetical protein
MNRRVRSLIVGSLLLLVGCGGEVPFGIEGEDPTGQVQTFRRRSRRRSWCF